MKQLCSNPEYGEYVCSFTWSMMGTHLELYQYLPDFLHGKRPLWKLEDNYDMFACLRKVKYIDIFTHSRHIAPCVELPSLFPMATHITLSRKMHYAVATAILHGPNKPDLISLSLNNVQEGGLVRERGRTSGENFRWWGKGVLNLYCTDQSRALEMTYFEESWPEGCLPIQVKPSCMRRLLPGLQYRCIH